MNTTLLLEHLDWVRTLAYRLVKDQNVADDLVQEAWLAAEKSGSIKPEAARGWFASVLRRKVSERHWQEAGRRAREQRVARPEGVRSDSHLHDQVEVEQLVVREVMALDEPYRRTVLLRHFEELPLAEIAASEGVTMSAVKSRLTRAHAALRERLDARYGKDGRGWMLALIPIAKAPKAKAATALGGTLFLVVAATLAALTGVTLWGLLQAPESSSELVSVAVSSTPARALGQDPVAVSDQSKARTGRQAILAPKIEEVLDRTETLRLRVVDDATGNEIAGATGWVVDDLDVRNPDFLMAAQGSRVAALRRFGRKVITDEGGHASIPCAMGEVRGAILSDSWFGEISVRNGFMDVVEVRAKPNAPMYVRVVDANGQTMPGVPVAFGGIASSGTMIEVGPTDDLGVAKVPMAGWYWDQNRSTGKNVAVAVHLPGLEASAAPVVGSEDGALPSGPIEITCPPLGELRIDASGVEVDFGAIFVSLPDRASSQVRPRTRSGSLVSLDADGQGVIRCGLGQELQAVWTQNREPQQMTFVSSASSSTPRRIRLAPTPRPKKPEVDRSMNAAGKLVVQGRVLNQREEPIVSGKLKIQLGSHSMTDVPNSIGRFSMTRSAPAPSEFPITAEILLDRRPRASFRAVEIAAMPSDGRIDLGDVLLQPCALLASGVVENSGGDPVAGAKVSFSAEVKGQPFPRDDAAPYWADVNDPFGMTDAEGRFKIYCPPLETLRLLMGKPTGRVRVQAVHSSGRSEFALATPLTETRLRLLETSPIEISLESVNTELQRQINMTMLREGDRSGTRCSKGNGVASWSKLLPGTYTLEVRHSQFENPVVSYSNLEVTAEGCADPRLAQFDLSQKLDSCRVLVKDHLGQPAPGVTVWVHHEDGSGGARGAVTHKNGTAMIVARPGKPRRISAGEFDPDNEPTFAVEGAILQLEKPVLVRIRLAQNIALRDPAEFISVWLRRLQGGTLGRFSPEAAPDKDGWIEIEVPEVGKYRCTWARGRHRSGHASRVFGAPTGEVIHVIEDGQAVDLTVPDEVVQIVNGL